MRPVFQTRYRRPEGNCLMACIASLLEIPLESCPDLHVAEQRGEHYWAVMADFVRARGFQPVWMTPEYLAGSVPIGYAAVAGRGARGDDHVCVAHDGRIVHDPLPYGGGLLDVKGWIVLVPVAALGPAASQNAGATPTDTPVEVDAHNSSSSSLLSPVEGRTNEDDHARTGEASTATDGAATASTNEKA